MNALHQLGWTGFFQSQYDLLKNTDLLPARVAADHRGTLELLTASGPLSATLSGRLRHESLDEDLPVVGDWVLVKTDGAGSGVVVGRLDRRSRLIRQAAGGKLQAQILGANLDVVFVVTSLNRELSLSRIERYLVSIHESGATPVLILSKADLVDDPDRVSQRVLRAAAGAPVEIVSALQGRGIEELDRYLGPGVTAAFVGSSGVGKSTLINSLLGRQRQLVKAIRSDDDEGRHTTTHRQLILLPDDRGLLMDTPGIRELQLWGGAELDTAFEDIENLGRDCRYRDCAHQDEPGCAVREAIEAGALAEARLSNYDKLGRELAWQERRQDKAAERRRNKNFGRQIKAVVKQRREKW